MVRAFIQDKVFDVSDWSPDDYFANYPEGARAKKAFFAPPSERSKLIDRRRRYMFKYSDRRYPDQFWGEVVAYLVGCQLGVSVPKAFAAINSKNGDSGALIEWFYEDGVLEHRLGGTFMNLVIADFDFKRGKKHNFLSIESICKAFVASKLMQHDWERWWCEAFLFDALIGNTDRHQDNWGVLFKRRQRMPGSTAPPFSIAFAPLFDNGTSLGNEKAIGTLETWTDAQLSQYLDKGQHHAKWSLESENRCGHIEMLLFLRASKPRQVANMLTKIKAFSIGHLIPRLDALCQLQSNVPLTQGRKNMYIRIINARRQRIIEALT